MSTDRPVLLSVDDEANVLKALQRTLRKVDVDVLTAQSGQDGLDILRARNVDIILSDMRMPGMSGPEFLKAAAELQPDSQRIVLTGHADAESAQAAINDGKVSLYLNKPWDDEELRRVVTETIKVCNLKQENRRLAELTQQQNEALNALNEELEARVQRRTEALEHTNQVLANTLHELEETHRHMVDLVANIAAMPHPESEHSRLKLQLVLAICEELGVEEEEQLYLRDAVRLHRVGWIALDEATKTTPRQKMKPEQRQRFENHPDYAKAVLLGVPSLKKASEIVAAQHEAFNGEGFPNRSVGEGIPLGSRILAVARDYYDLQGGCILSNKLTPADSVQHIVDGAETAYDPEVVKAFRATVASVEEHNPNVDEVKVKTISLLPGMRVSRDVTSNEGVVLLAKGIELTENIIGTFINLEKRSDQDLDIFVLRKDEP